VQTKIGSKKSEEYLKNSTILQEHLEPAQFSKEKVISRMKKATKI